MHGDRPTVSCFQAVLTPRPGVGLIYSTGRPSEWVLNEFASCIRVVLGQARIGGMPFTRFDVPGTPLGMEPLLTLRLGVSRSGPYISIRDSRHAKNPSQRERSLVLLKEALRERGRELVPCPPFPSDIARFEFRHNPPERLRRRFPGLLATLIRLLEKPR